MRREFRNIGSIQDVLVNLEEIKEAKEQDKLLELDVEKFPEWAAYITEIEGKVEPEKELDIEIFYKKLYEAWQKMTAVNILQEDPAYEITSCMIKTTEILLERIATLVSDLHLVEED